MTKHLLRPALLVMALWAAFAASAAESLSIPYVNACNDKTTATLVSGTTKSWTSSTGSGGYFQIQRKSSSVGYDAAAFFGPFDLKGGTAYRIDADIATSSTAYKAVAKVGTATSPAINYINVFGTNASVVSTSATVPVTVPFYYQPATDMDGVYICVYFDSETPASFTYLRLFQFAIETVASIPPGQVSDIVVTPDATGLKKADFSFKAPATDAVGNALSSLDAVKVLWEGNEIYSKSSPTPGETLTFSRDFSQATKHTFQFYAYRDGVASQMAETSVQIGSSIPALSMTNSSTDGYGARHTYRAQYMPTGEVKLALDYIAAEKHKGNGETFTVVRMPDNVTVATASSTADVTDTAFPTDKRVSYWYVATVYDADGGATSTQYTSSVISINNPTDYLVAFSYNRETPTDNAISEMTLFDISGKGYVWNYNTNGFASTNNTDNMLVTPGVKLEKGKFYRFSATVSAANSGVGFELLRGLSNHPDYQTVKVRDYELAVFSQEEPAYGYFQADTTANVFFSIHGYNTDNPDNLNTIRLHGLTVTEVSDDLPGPVADLNVSYTSSTAAVISFTASPTNIGGTAQRSLTAVYVYKDGELIKTFENPTPGQTYTLDVPVESGVTSTYRVTPANEAGTGDYAEVKVGLITPPYSNAFDSKDALVGYDIVDVGLDGFTWHIQSNKARAYDNMSNCLNDWLITPPIHLEGGQWYKAQYNTWSDSDGTDNTLTLYIGTKSDPSAMTTAVVGPTAVTNTSAARVKDYFSVAETGEYYLAFHAFNDKENACPLWLTDFTLSAPISAEVPAAGEITVTPDALGALKADVTVTLPTKTIAGAELTSLTKLTLYIDDVQTAEKTVALGDGTATFNLTDLTEGIHEFAVYPSNSYGTGRECEAKAYIGINVPSYPLDFTVSLTDEDGQVHFSWNPPTTDKDGFPINPDLLTYDLFIYTYDSTDGASELTFAGNLSTTEYTYRVQGSTAEQQFYRFGVRAYTSKGGGSGFLAPYIAVGPAYKMPFLESWASYTPEHLFRFLNYDNYLFSSWGYAPSNLIGIPCFDGDDGYACFEAISAGASSALVSGRVSITGTKPQLSIFTYNLAEDGNVDTNKLGFKVCPRGSTEFVEVATKTVNEWAGGLPGWQKIIVDLSDYVGKEIEIALTGEAWSNQYILVDRMQVTEAPAIDMNAACVTVPEELFIGVDNALTGTIRNTGTAEASGTVTLMRDGRDIAKQEFTLAAGAMKTVDFADRFDAADVSDTRTFTYTIYVEAEGDVDVTDNTSGEVTAKVVDNSGYPTVQNLLATSGDDSQSINVTWTAPDVPEKASEITDDLESYPSWSTMYTGVGDYTFIDADGVGVSQVVGIDWPIPLASDQSFFLCDFSDTCFIAAREAYPTRFIAHSGDKAFVSICPYDRSNYGTDDWLILPRLSGDAQTISFYARSASEGYPENFYVYTSTTSRSESAFTQIGFESSIPAEYTKYSYEVPAGTKYFAIRHYKFYGFLFYVDDITFTPAGNEELVLQGYRVRQSGDVVADYDATSRKHVDTAPKDGVNSYVVSAVYNRGEGPGTEVLAEFSAIDRMLTGAPVAIGDRGCIRVYNADGETVTVFDTAGRVVYTGDARSEIPATAGVYIVRIAADTFKVAVR